MKDRISEAVRALLGRPLHQPPAPPSPLAAPPVSPSLDEAIDVLKKTPIAEIQSCGYHFQKRDFYSALNDLEFLSENRDLWHDRGMPRGVEWNLPGQLSVVRNLAPYCHELEHVPQDMPEGPPKYHWRNVFWSGLDALVHYGLLRDRKPRRVVEIGCGWSSLLMAQALERNESDGAPPAVVDQIEPYPRKELLRALPSHWKLHETILQRAPFELFESLQAGDVCFYDGSHVARPGSDVVWFFFEVVPRLKPGVLIHVHDVFWPFDYPDDWIFERGQTWNEQYVFQAFLMYNEQFAPLICNVALIDSHGPDLAELFSALPVTHHGSSVWLRRLNPRSCSP